MKDTNETQKAISFKFSKTVEKKTLANVELGVSPSEFSNHVEDKKDFIVNYDKKRSKSKKYEIACSNPTLKVDENVDSLTKEAMDELIKNSGTIVLDIEDKQKKISIINTDIIAGVDVVEEDYDVMPFEEFGKAALRGMGWKDGETKVSLYEHKRSFGLQINKKIREDEPILCKGAYCIFMSGNRTGQYGKVIDDDGVRMEVEMAKSGETIDTSMACLKAVSKTEFEKNKKYINNITPEESLVGGGERDERDQRKVKIHKSEERDGERNRWMDKEERRGDREDKNERSRKSREVDGLDHLIKDNRSSPSLKRRRTEPPKEIPQQHHNSYNNNRNLSKHQMWLHPNLVVRIIDKKLKGGKYYKEKVVIEDVIKPYVCNCRTTDHKLIEDLHQDQLETVIPREIPATIMIVKGKHKSQVAEILHKDKEDCKIVASLVNNELESVNLDFDDVCQFIVNNS